MDVGDTTHPDPIGFFFTWTTYGTWLPGDERGWVKRHKGFQYPDLKHKRAAQQSLKERPCFLNRIERDVVERTIAEHCRIRRWHLYEVSCRSNHVHAVLYCNKRPKVARSELKAWCTRKLKEIPPHLRSPRNRGRGEWWTEGGSIRRLYDTDDLEGAIIYVTEGQKPRRFCAR